MIDLLSIARMLIAPAVHLSMGEQKIDDTAIKSVHIKTQTKRREDLQNCLRHYTVLMGFKNSTRDKIVTSVLKFADMNGCDLNLGKDSTLYDKFDKLIDNFNILYYECCSVVPSNKNNNPRDLTSLTSKALWCCYPNAVPLYDRFAQNAVWVLGRLTDIKPDSRFMKQRYAAFSYIWIKMYDEVLPLINQADLKGYPNKVRVFDRILWIIGEENYNRDPYKAGSRAARRKDDASLKPY